MTLLVLTIFGNETKVGCKDISIDVSLTNVDLTLLIGQYAQKYYLGLAKKKTLTETVENYKSYLPQFFVLPHPSPRNNIWMKKNPWFKATVLPDLKEAVKKLI